MAQTFKFRWPIFVGYDESGMLYTNDSLSELGDDRGLSVRSALWVERQDEWEFHLSNGFTVNVPGRNIACILSHPIDAEDGNEPVPDVMSDPYR